MTVRRNQTPARESAGSSEHFESVKWFELEPRKKKWLVFGLLLRRGSSILAGKPKAGKSVCAKNIAVAVVKGREVLGRTVDTEGRAGRVIYLQLEGKDDVSSTAEQFRALGITEEESKRLLILQRTLQRGVLEQRVQELIEMLKKFGADLVVVDTLRLFTGKAVNDINSYDDTIEAMDKIEPLLRAAGWMGHLMVVHHGRKDDERKNQMLDSILGSSGLAASFNTVMLVSQPDDDEPLRLLSSKQNETDKNFGDMLRTELLMNQDTFQVSLGRTHKEIFTEKKQHAKAELGAQIHTHLDNHPKSTLLEIKSAIGAREQTVRELLDISLTSGVVVSSGKGTRGKPRTFSLSKQFLESLKERGAA
jgi:RecA-family ATPase